MEKILTILLCTALSLLQVNGRWINSGDCPALELISREGWGARDPTGVEIMDSQVPFVVIHHTVMGEGECDSRENCSRVMREIQDLHMDTNGWADIGYTFLVGGDGAIYEGRGWNRVGAHAPGQSCII